jgi:hypothetical protein
MRGGVHHTGLMPKEFTMRLTFVLPAVALVAFGANAIQAADSDDAKGEKRELRKEEKEHPRMAAALKELDEAIAELKKAPHDFGGHRDDAIKACEAARDQLKVALEYRADHDEKK